MNTIKKKMHIDDVINEDNKVQQYIQNIVRKLRDAEEEVVAM
jgi:hypothetical protein